MRRTPRYLWFVRRYDNSLTEQNFDTKKEAETWIAENGDGTYEPVKMFLKMAKWQGE